MTPAPDAFAAAAEGLVGTRFRLHGRDPRFGLDCVGLVAAALERCGGPARAPTGYALRQSDIAAHLPFAPIAGFLPASGPARRGDLLLLRPGPAQYHLAIARDAVGIVHAHAGLRRVVVQPLAPAQSIARLWRLPSE